MPTMNCHPTRSVRLVRQGVPFGILLLLGLVLWPAGAFCETPEDGEGKETPGQVSDRLKHGQLIYQSQCAVCHGENGQGTDDGYADPLAGDMPLTELVTLITDTMPEGDPELCVGEDAHAVAEYIYHEFYSEEAQRRRAPHAQLARLTGDQLRRSLADLYRRFHGDVPEFEQHGLLGRYYEGTRRNDDNKKIERVDAVVQFDFGHEGPGEGIPGDEFSIQWTGAIQPDVTGTHEIVIRSTCAFMCYFGADDRELINNNVQSGDKTEFRQAIVLTAGQIYPIRIDFYQRKRKTEQPPATFSLAWVAPGQVERLIPSRNLVSVRAPATFSLQAKLPPDDRTYGYERGIAVDQQWDESTTAAAIEFSEAVVQELWPAQRNAGRRRRGRRGGGRRGDQSEESNAGRERLREFLTQLVETAFRRQLDEPLRTVYIDDHFAATEDDNEAITRVVLMALKSPRFLYPLLDADQPASQRAANRLTLTLFDSLPSDRWLLEEVRENRLEDPDAIRQAAERMVNDPRTRAKMREFLYGWLSVNPLDEISKDAEDFAGFDAEIVSDLQLSLATFLDAVVWSEASDFRELLRADFSYTTPRLAEYYGEPWKADTESESIAGLARSVQNSERHAGVLTHPYLMSRLAYMDSTSPIHRGVFLLRNVLGRTLRPPQEAFSPLSPDLHPDLTTRERVILQTSPESCQVCHAKINALGFTLENLDAVGRYRTEERGRPVDTRGQYTTRAENLVEFTGPRELAEFLATSEDVHRAFVDRMFEHFVKQPAAAYGADTLDVLTRKFVESNFNIRQLAVEIAVIAATHQPPLPDVTSTASTQEQ